MKVASAKWNQCRNFACSGVPCFGSSRPLPVFGEEVLRDRAGLVQDQSVFVHGGHLAERMDREIGLRLQIRRREVERLQFIGNAQFLAKPDDADGARVFRVVNLEHDISLAASLRTPLSSLRPV